MTETTATLARTRAYLLPLAVFLVVWFGMLVWPPLHLVALLADDFSPGTPTLLALMVLPIAGRLAYELAPGPLSRAISTLSLTWLGLCFLLLSTIVVVEPLALLLGASAELRGLLVAGIWLTLAAVGLVGGQRLTLVHVPVAAAALDAPLTVVQISDVHVGSRSPRFLDRVIRRIEAIDPDAVCVTGDLIDFRDVPAAALAPFARLDCPVWFAIGNHERYVDCEAICERLEAQGVRVLRDAVDSSVAPLVVVGIDDGGSRRRVRRGLEAIGPLPEGYRILLYHRPDGLEDAAEAGVDLMLCGHTHAGQIRPFDLLVRRVFPRLRGLHRRDPTRMWVSQGTGTWGPVLRLGSACEITVLELTP